MTNARNIRTTSERADKKVWENNGLSGSNSDVVIANENSFDLAFIYALKCFLKNEEEEDIFQTRDSKAISKAVSKEESSL